MDVHLAPAQAAKEADLPAISQLLSEVFGPERDWAEELRWQYLRNPSGKALYVNAYNGTGALIAHYAVVPTNPVAEQHFSDVQTYLSLNTAVHPKAQGKGLFKKTAQALYDHLSGLGHHVVLGVANENSVHGFITSLGFHLLGQLKVEAYLPGQSPKPQAPRLLAVTPESVHWRYSRPFGGYKVSSKGQVFCTRKFKGFPIHCILTAGDLGASPKMLTENHGHTARRFCPAIYATYGPTSRFALLVPENMRPSPFHLICRPYLDGSPLNLLNHIQKCRFELFDFDVV